MSNEPTTDRASQHAARSASPDASGPSARIRSIRRPPLTIGVYAISAICGMLDAASFLGLGHIFVETMTGNILFFAFSLGTRDFPQFAPDISAVVLPYLAALGSFAVGAVAGGRLRRAGETGRRAGFAADAMLIGVAVLVVVLTHPGPTGYARYLVVGVLAVAMGIQNALMRRWGIPDLATNLMTLTFTDLLADSTLGGGNNPRAGRRSVSMLIFTLGAVLGALMTVHGVLWPMLTSFALFALALPILLQPLRESKTPPITVLINCTGRTASQDRSSWVIGRRSPGHPWATQ